MKKISIALFSIIAMAGVASAQQAKGSASAGATVNAGAATKTATGAATGAAGAATGAAKTGAAATADVKMEMPKPPAEIAATLKMMGPSGKCTGSGFGGPDMKTEMKFKATATRKADLDGWWIHESMNGTMGEGKNSGKFKMEAYMTWDAKAGKWNTMSVMNSGEAMMGTADMKDGKWESQSTTSGGMMGGGMFREHGDMTDKKAGMHMWGEASMDNGKTWTKVFDMTCK